MIPIGFDIQPQEKLIVVLRSHWFVLLATLLRFVIIIALVLGAGHFLISYLDLVILQNLFPFLASIFLLFWWLFLFHTLTDYFLDVWIVTDHRLLDIQHVGLFNREVSEMRLSKIQDISVKVRGFIPTMLDFGDILVQTAGEEKEFVFQAMHHPEEIKNLILNAYDGYTKEHPGGTEPHM